MSVPSRRSVILTPMRNPRDSTASRVKSDEMEDVEEERGDGDEEAEEAGAAEIGVSKRSMNLLR